MFSTGVFLLKLNVCFLEDVNFFISEQTYSFSTGSNKPVFHCVQDIEQLNIEH